MECLSDGKKKHSIDKYTTGPCHLRSNNGALGTSRLLLLEGVDETSSIEYTTPGAVAICRASGHKLSFRCASLGFFLPLHHFRMHVFALLPPYFFGFFLPLPHFADLSWAVFNLQSAQFSALFLLVQYTNHPVHSFLAPVSSTRLARLGLPSKRSQPYA